MYIMEWVTEYSWELDPMRFMGGGSFHRHLIAL